MISVIVPVYNTKEYLPRCMKSLLAQDYSDKEILLVDDGSTDESGSLCDKYADEYPCVRVLHKTNGGLISAWIAGVKESRGEYLCFVDSDDWVEEDMLVSMAPYLTGRKDEVVVCNYSIDREDGSRQLQTNTLEPGVYEGTEYEQKVIPQLLGNEHRKISLSRCMKLISRELVEKNLGFCDLRVRMGEDVNIMLPVLLDAKRLVVMEEAYFYHYYFNQSSIVHKYNAGLYENLRLLRQALSQVIEEKCTGNLKEVLLAQADKEYVFLLMLIPKNEVRGNKKGCRDNLKAIFGDKEICDLLQKTPVTISEKSNCLIYQVMKHPTGLWITVLQAALAVHDR